MIAEFSGPPIPVEVHLRGSDPKHQLALYQAVYTENLHAVPPATRYCCASDSELVVTLNVSGYFDAIAVAFEQAGGGPPSPADRQSFELTARAVR